MAHSRVQVTPYVFRGPNQVGDFAWMINRPEYQDTLFLFNDNQEQFTAFIYNDWRNNRDSYQYACGVGGGNAVIRPYQCANPPRAAGIPTGVNRRGYTASEGRQYIDVAFQHIHQLLATGKYRRVAYSATPNGKLGVDIFGPAPTVVDYITYSIQRLAR